MVKPSDRVRIAAHETNSVDGRTGTVVARSACDPLWVVSLDADAPFPAWAPTGAVLVAAEQLTVLP